MTNEVHHKLYQFSEEMSLSYCKSRIKVEVKVIAIGEIS